MDISCTRRIFLSEFSCELTVCDQHDEMGSEVWRHLLPETVPKHHARDQRLEVHQESIGQEKHAL